MNSFVHVKRKCRIAQRNRVFSSKLGFFARFVINDRPCFLCHLFNPRFSLLCLAMQHRVNNNALASNAHQCQFESSNPENP